MTETSAGVAGDVVLGFGKGAEREVTFWRRTSRAHCRRRLTERCWWQTLDQSLPLLASGRPTAPARRGTTSSATASSTRSSRSSRGLRLATSSNGTRAWSRPVVLPTTLFLTPFLPALAPAFMTRAGAPLCPDGHVGQKSTVGICHGVSESLSAICSSRPSARALVSQALENG